MSRVRQIFLTISFSIILLNHRFTKDI